VDGFPEWAAAQLPVEGFLSPARLTPQPAALINDQP